MKPVIELPCPESTLLHTLTTGFVEMSGEDSTPLKPDHRLHVVEEAKTPGVYWLQVHMTSLQAQQGTSTVLADIEVCHEHGRPMLRVWTRDTLGRPPLCEIDLQGGVVAPAGHFRGLEAQQLQLLAPDHLPYQNPPVQLEPALAPLTPGGAQQEHHLRQLRIEEWHDRFVVPGMYGEHRLSTPRKLSTEEALLLFALERNGYEVKGESLGRKQGGSWHGHAECKNHIREMALVQMAPDRLSLLWTLWQQVSEGGVLTEHHLQGGLRRKHIRELQQVCQARKLQGTVEEEVR